MSLKRRLTMSTGVRRWTCGLVSIALCICFFGFVGDVCLASAKMLDMNEELLLCSVGIGTIKCNLVS